MLIRAENVSFGYAGEQLLTDIGFTLSEGDRVGLIGANGEGKTTLIKLALGVLTPDEGSISKKNSAKIGYLAQNGGFDSENTVFEEMRSVFAEDERAIKQLREAELKIAKTDEDSLEYRTLSAKYESLNKFISARNSYEFEIKIRTVLNGMGFADRYEQKVSTMSGGEKTRLQLARLLLENPDLLVLDEPTNHLDLKTLFWLEEYLSSYKGAILTVSHDRFFLDKIVTEIYELENKRLSVFKGNYTKYKVLKAEKTERLLKEYEKQREELAKLQEYVDRNLVRASTAKSALSRAKKIEKTEILEKPTLPPAPPRFSFSYAERPYERVLEIGGLTLTAGEKTLLKDFSFTLTRGEKCAIVGDNGTGKTTLIKKIVQSAYGSDEIRLGRFVKIAYYDQENATLDPENTVLGELWGRHVLWEQTKTRNILASAGLFQEDVDKKVKNLSGGERAKLALAVFECEEGNLLLLDEPTNHLDLAARESLETALKAFDGSVLFVSHDRYFIDAVAGKILEFSGDASATVFNGTYAAYAEEKKEQREQENNAPKKTEKKENTSYRSKEDRAKDAKKRARIKEIEEKIPLLEQEEGEISAELATPRVTGDYKLLAEYCARLEKIKQETDELYEEYETLLS